MNESHSYYTQIFAGFAGIASALGIGTQDLIYLLFAVIGLVLSISSFICNRLDQRRRYAEEKKRTAILEKLVDIEAQKAPEERKAGLGHLKDVVSKMTKVNL